MANRVKIVEKKASKKAPTGGAYFDSPEAEVVERVHSGCTVLDCALGGGWAKDRTINIVGDSSTGKTLLATEFAANFHTKFPDGRIRYRDAESAYSIPYGETIGLPTDAVDFGDPEKPFDTVEDFEADLTRFCQRLPTGVSGLYILDSLDALSSEDEMTVKRDDDGKEKGSYGTGKAKKMSALFRRCVREMRKARVTLVVISQTRDAIGVTFGERQTRAGGKALDFYARQIVWLAKLGKVSKTKGGIERTIGQDIRANVKKNHCGDPYRQADFPILFNFGVDDVKSGLNFLNTVKRLDAVGLDNTPVKEEDDEPKKTDWRGKAKVKKSSALNKLLSSIDRMPDEEYRTFCKTVRKAVKRVWAEVEADFAPPRRKYA